METESRLRRLNELREAWERAETVRLALYEDHEMGIGARMLADVKADPSATIATLAKAYGVDDDARVLAYLLNQSRPKARRVVVVTAASECEWATYHEIAEAFGLGTARVATLAKEAGISRGQGRRPGAPKVTQRYAEIAALRDEGLSYREIAERYGVSRQRIGEIVKRYRARLAAEGN